MSTRRIFARFVLGLCCFVPLVVATVAWSAGEEPADADVDDEEGYVRPVKTNPEIDEALEDLGVKVVSFAIRCPPNYKAAVSLVGTDGTGKVVKDTGFKVIGFHGHEGQEEWIVRLARIDPQAMNEDYDGKIRWRMTCRSKHGGSVSTNKWDRDWLRARGAVGRGTNSGGGVEGPEGGTNYEVWRTEVMRAGPRKGPDDGIIFRYRLLVKFSLFKPDDFDGFGTHAVSDDDA